jgi:hypothetical protein
MEFFEQAEAEYQAALAKQAAERRAEVQAERAKVKKEADAIYTALVDAFPAPSETPAAPRRSFLDEVRDKLPVTPQQRERWQIEEHGRRRAGVVAAEMQEHKRGQSNELGVKGYLGPDIDLDDPEFDDDEEFDD